MELRVNAFLRRQQQRFMRPDAARYLRPDAARFLKPGSGQASVFPALARKYEGQPRIPEGEEGGGQFTFGDQEPSGRPRIYITRTNDIGAGGPGDGADGGAGSALGDELDRFLLAGDLGGPGDQPPEIPENKPSTSAQRNAVLRAIASFLGRNSSLIGDVFIGLLNQIEWFESYQDLIQAARDPPKTMRELQENVGKKRPGYDDHHIVEKTAAERWGMPRSEIDDPSNIVSIPRLKHYQITAWYMTKNQDYGGLSPREYLSDKSLDERRAVGLKVLVLYKVLKP